MRPDQEQLEDHADDRRCEADDDQPPLGVALGEPVGARRSQEDADRRGREDQARLDRVIAVDFLQEYGGGEEGAEAPASTRNR